MREKNKEKVNKKEERKNKISLWGSRFREDKMVNNSICNKSQGSMNMNRGKLYDRMENVKDKEHMVVGEGGWEAT